MPILLQKYFLCDFNFSIFASQNEYLINEEYITTYVANNCYVNLKSRVHEMFHDYRFIRFRIHPEFPSDVLFKIMKPYLELYYISMYSMNENRKSNASKLLYKKLRAFKKFNPAFGRKKMKLSKTNPFSKGSNKTVVFDDAHIPFYEKPMSTDEFMKTHTYKKEIYESSPYNNNNGSLMNQHNYFSDSADEMPRLIPIDEILRFNMDDYDDGEEDTQVVIVGDNGIHENDHEGQVQENEESESSDSEDENDDNESHSDSDNDSDSDSHDENETNRRHSEMDEEDMLDNDSEDDE